MKTIFHFILIEHTHINLEINMIAACFLRSVGHFDLGWATVLVLKWWKDSTERSY